MSPHVLMLSSRLTSLQAPFARHNASCRRALCVRAAERDAGSADINKPLKNPARIGASAKSKLKVQDLGHDVRLESYMRLPVEQYHNIDPDVIAPLHGSTYMLMVPRISIFNIWLEPQVEVVVKRYDDEDDPRVELEATKCRLLGPPLVESLNSLFTLHFLTTLRWSSTYAPLRPDVASNGNGASAQSSGSNGSPDAARREASALASTSGTWDAEISAQADLKVESEVVAPFNLIPRFVLEGTCSTVVTGVFNTLLPTFLSRLGADYTKWAMDPTYRAMRAAQPSGAASEQQEGAAAL